MNIDKVPHLYAGTVLRDCSQPEPGFFARVGKNEPASVMFDLFNVIVRYPGAGLWICIHLLRIQTLLLF